MKRSKLCPYKQLCKDVCYGDDPCCFAEAFDVLDRKITRLKAENKKVKEDLDFTICQLARYRAAYGYEEPKIIPNNRPIGRWEEVKELIHAAPDGSAFCYSLRYKCPECGALEDKVRKHCPECGADMGLQEA